MDEAFSLTSEYNLTGFLLKDIKGSFICRLSCSHLAGPIPETLVSVSYTINVANHKLLNVFPL